MTVKQTVTLDSETDSQIRTVRQSNEIVTHAGFLSRQLGMISHTCGFLSPAQNYEDCFIVCIMLSKDVL